MVPFLRAAYADTAPGMRGLRGEPADSACAAAAPRRLDRAAVHSLAPYLSWYGDSQAGAAKTRRLTSCASMDPSAGQSLLIAYAL